MGSGRFAFFGALALKNTADAANPLHSGSESQTFIRPQL